MHFLSIHLLTLTLNIAALAVPITDVTYPRSDVPYLPLVITDLVLFQSYPNIGLPSFISFAFSDPEPRRNHTIAGNCTHSVSSNTSLHMGDYDSQVCSSEDFSFKYWENNIMLMRWWWYEDTWTKGFAPAATNWTADNTSVSPVGLAYSRNEPWYIPITMIIA